MGLQRAELAARPRLADRPAVGDEIEVERIVELRNQLFEENMRLAARGARRHPAEVLGDAKDVSVYRKRRKYGLQLYGI
jgi:hypothetical protein